MRAYFFELNIPGIERTVAKEAHENMQVQNPSPLLLIHSNIDI